MAFPKRVFIDRSFNFAFRFQFFQNVYVFFKLEFSHEQAPVKAKSHIRLPKLVDESTNLNNNENLFSFDSGYNEADNFRRTRNKTSFMNFPSKSVQVDRIFLPLT